MSCRPKEGQVLQGRAREALALPLRLHVPAEGSQLFMEQ